MNYFRGKVIQGKKRGRKLGFPTVNVRLHKALAEGIFVSETKVDDKWYKSVSFVGAAKTFDETEIFGETYIFDFKRDIYGKWVSVRLLAKIRDNQNFKTEAELIERVEKDKKEALLFFKAAGKNGH